MSALQTKIKNALDEVRILILGLQVLIGFQFRAFFEKGYEQLSALDRGFELAALFALLAALALLFLPAARHRQVEEGNDTARFHRFTMLVMRAALFPFAAALSAEVFVAADRIAGRAAAAAGAALAGAVALGFWYGHFLRRDRRDHGEPEDAVETTKLERRIDQVLTETRVVLPGVQALLGFQLAMTLLEPFERLPQAVKLVHLASLGLMTLAMIVLMSPAAYHRIVEQGHDSERFHRFASRMVILALILIGPAFAADLYVVLQKAGHAEASAPAAAAALACFYGAWFGAMQILRRLRRPEVAAAARAHARD